MGQLAEQMEDYRAALGMSGELAQVGGGACLPACLPVGVHAGGCAAAGWGVEPLHGGGGGGACVGCEPPGAGGTLG